MNDEMGAIGYAPTVVVSNVRPEEKELYKTMWDNPAYRNVSPGELLASEFVMQARPKPGAHVLDLGCGTGRGGLTIAVLGNAKVTFVDFAPNCLDEDVANAVKNQEVLDFVEADLTKELPVTAEYGFCTDVLEHIPTQDVDKVLKNCLMACQHVFFNISTVEDHFGKTVGHPLHLTVQPYEWWLKKLQDLDCVVHWSRDDGASCCFYVTAWQTGQQVADRGAVNTSVERIRENVETNVKNGWMQIQPYPTNDVEVMILGGGPTLKNHLDKIRELRESGVKLICLNGAYGWAIENGLTPSAMVMVDARSFNSRFTKPVVDGCKYFIGSQCDPIALEELPQERTYLWHTMADDIKDILDANYKAYWPVPGGCTVLLRAIPLFRMLGFRKFHLIGCDSCIMDDQHHAYTQTENDGQTVIPVSVGGRIFKCNAWMVAQAHEFIETVKYLGDEIELEVYGDGLLHHILVAGAEHFEEGPAELI